MKLLVCGGRFYNNYEYLNEQLWKLHTADPIDLLIHGAAKGADSLAGRWAREVGVQEVICPANWTKLGKRAGYVRNAAMLHLQPNVVLAFSGGKGTDMMKKLAREAGVHVMEA